MTGKKKSDLTRQVLEYRLDDSLGFMVTMTERRLKKYFIGIANSEGFNYGLWFFIRVLFEEDGLTQKELSDRVGMMQPTAVKALRSMAEHGFVRIEEDADDKRRMRIFLTDAGRQVGRQVLPKLKELNQFALRDVTKEEFKALRSILRKVRANLDAGGFDPRTKSD